MGYSIEVYDHNFEEEVLAKSYETPIIVDFFATWCGPCQMLKPILENVAKEYDCIVAKVNVEENQYLAQAFKIEGIPDVKVIKEGKVVDSFVGVLPDDQLAEFLAKCNISSRIDERVAAIKTNIAAGELEQAEQQWRSLLQDYPDNPKLAIAAAKFFIGIDRLEDAEAVISKLDEFDKNYEAQLKAIRSLIYFRKEAIHPSGDREIDRQFSKAAALTLEGQYEEALKLFIDIVETDRTYKDDGARKGAIAIFDLLGNDHPLTKEYRKKLMLALY
jgi:putative thioredoxin